MLHSLTFSLLLCSVRNDLVGISPSRLTFDVVNGKHV